MLVPTFASLFLIIINCMYRCPPLPGEQDYSCPSHEWGGSVGSEIIPVPAMKRGSVGSEIIPVPDMERAGGGGEREGNVCPPS